MQAAQVLCGYTLGGADLLRRAMGKKIKAEMDAQRSVFVDGAIKHSGLTHEYASEIFDLIAKFADYGFNKSHAAAYAFITYQTAWLKTHYPVQFMAALMSLDKGNTDKLAIFKQAVTRMGLTLLPPDINQSGSDFLVEECHPGEGRDPVTSELQPTPGRHNLAIRYSLAALKGVGEGAIDQIVAERAARGPFVSLADFLVRIDPKWVNRRQIEVLAAAGAFECLYPERAVLYAGADNMLAFAATKADERATGQTNLFGGETQAPRDSDILLPVAKWDLLEKLHFEFEAVGFYLSAHPLDPRRAQLEKMGVVSFGDIPRLLDTRPSTRVKLAGVVIKRQEKMSKSGKKFAFLTLSDSTGVYEATVFSETLARSRDIMVAGQTLLVTADAEMQDENLRLTIQDVRLLDDSLIRSVRAVTLELENDRGLAQLQKIMASEDKGLVQLKVDVPLATGERILMVLPGRYAYQPATRDALYQLDGLKMVHES